MKFFKNNNFSNKYCKDDFFLQNLDYFYDFFEFKKNNPKNRKYLYSSRPGTSKNIKKASMLRNTGNSLIQLFLNLNTKKGKKYLIYKNFNILIENFFFSFNYFSKEFSMYKNYSNFFYIYNSSLDYKSFEKIFEELTIGLESVFEIKTKKNNKKLKLKDKYSHEIIYIPKKKRLKYILRALSFYKENFKKYYLWERLFWSFITVLINKENSFLKKRREYIYVKSIKFFKKKPNALK